MNLANPLISILLFLTLFNLVYPLTTDIGGVFRYAGTCVTVPNAKEWALPSEATGPSDDITTETAKFNGISVKLTCSNFGLTMDPGAPIQGLSVVIRKGSTTTAGDFSVFLDNNGVATGSDLKSLLQWPINSLANFPYGGATNTWGGALSEGLVTSTNFGIQLIGEGFTSNTILSVDSISMRLFYTVTYTISSIAPLSTQYGDTLTITMSKAFDTPDLYCKFHTTIVAASYIDPTHVSCVIPLNPLEGLSDSVSLSVSMDGVNYEPSPTNFTYIGCSSFSSCESCVNTTDLLNCRWCPEDYVCRSTTIPCISGPSSEAGVCPTLSSVSPNLVLREGQQSVDVFGSYLFGATCDFVGYTSSSSSLIVSGHVRCLTPPNFPASTGNTTLRLIHPTNSNPVVNNTLEFSYFDCSTWSNTDCATCMAAPHDVCSWCLDTNTCYNPSSIGSCAGTLTSNGICPTISSAQPSVLAVGIGGDISISGSLFVPGISCKFGTFSTVPATVQSSTNLICTIGSNPSASVEPISLLNGAVPYTSGSTSFKWSTCSSETTCNGCINSLPDCGWCYQSQNCTSLAQCNDLGNSWSTIQCPAVTAIIPSIEEIEGNTVLSIEGSGFLSSLASDFQCRWGNPNPSPANVTIATRISSTKLQCPSIPSTSNASLPLYIGIGASPQEYTETAFPLEYLDCPTTSDCQTCRSTGNPSCIWCLNSDKCTLSHQCVPVGTPVPISVADAGSGINSGPFCPTIQDPSPATAVADQTVIVAIQSNVYVLDDSTYSCDWTCGTFTANTPATVANSTFIECSSPHLSQTDINSIAFPQTCAIIVKHGSFVHSTSSISFALTEPPKIGPKSPEQDDTSAIVMGTIAGVLFLGVSGGFFVYKRRIADALPQLEVSIPDPKMAVLGSFAQAQYDMTPERIAVGNNLFEVCSRNVPWNVVYNPESDVALPNLEFPIFAAMPHAMNISSADKLTNAMAWLLMEKKLIVDYLKAQIVRELETVPTDDMVNARGSLFRTNSFATKVWQPFGREIFLPYIFRCVVPTIYQICRDNPYTEQELEEMAPKKGGRSTIGKRKAANKSKTTTGISLETKQNTEIDPNRIKANESDGLFIASAQIQLQLHCQHILTNLFKGTGFLHPAGREVLSFISQAVGSFFPGSEHNVLSGFFFLRLLCPILITAENWGLTPEGKPPSEAARRTLILCVKIIQTLANGVIFGVKESFMVSFNPWIERNKPFLGTFFDKICEPNEPGVDIYSDHEVDNDDVSSPWEIAPQVHNEFLAYFINDMFYMKKLIPELEKLFPNQPIIIGPMKADYNRFHAAIGERVPKISK